jgi:ABC-type branched-subunit amino acid transport system substrate-binding protein
MLPWLQQPNMDTRYILTLLVSLILNLSLGQAQDYRVGVALPLSGPTQTYGVALQRGITLFTEEHAGSSLRFIYEDHQYQGAQTLSSARKLSEIDKVDLLLVWGVTPSGVAAPISPTLRAPLFTITTEPVAKDRPRSASLRLMISTFVDLTKQSIHKHQIKRFGLLGVNIGAVVELIEKFKADQVPLVFEELADGNTTDFRSLIVKLKQRQVDGLMLVLTPTQMGPFAEQAKQLHFSSHILSGDLLANDEARAKVRDLVGPVTYFYGATKQDFVQRYRARWGDTNNIFEAATGYSFAQIATKLSERGMRLDAAGAEQIISTLPELMLSDLAVGPLKFSKTAEFGMVAELGLIAIEDFGPAPASR